MSHWSASQMPPQQGRRAIVTGGSGGLGFATAQGLVRAGADVVIAGRNPGKGREAVTRIGRVAGSGRVRFEMLDLANLEFVAAFAERMLAAGQPLHVLVNNAGIMALPMRCVTADGFEMQFGVNYLGHYALTARLLPLMRAAGGARVVNVSSLAHRRGRIDFADLQGARLYDPWKAYGQSKLAMLMFALELQRRSLAGGWGVASLAAHPGWSRTDIVANGPGAGGSPGLFWRLADLATPLLSQSAADGALPILFAAAASHARPGGYYGPRQLSELKGPPGPATIAPQACDPVAVARLWEASETLTGVAFQS